MLSWPSHCKENWPTNTIWRFHLCKLIRRIKCLNLLLNTDASHLEWSLSDDVRLMSLTPPLAGEEEGPSNKPRPHPGLLRNMSRCWSWSQIPVHMDYNNAFKLCLMLLIRWSGKTNQIFIYFFCQSKSSKSGAESASCQWRLTSAQANAGRQDRATHLSPN